MNNRAFKIYSLNAVDPWTLGEMGEGLAKKLHKQLIKRKRRTIEKRDLRRCLND